MVLYENYILTEDGVWKYPSVEWAAYIFAACVEANDLSY